MRRSSSHFHSERHISLVVSTVADLVAIYLPEHMTDVKLFYLHELAADQAHLCPVRALADWINVSKVKTGHLFRRIWSGDRVADLDKDNAMVSILHRIFKLLSSCIECLI